MSDALGITLVQTHIMKITSASEAGSLEDFWQLRADSDDSILFESTAGQMVMTQALWSGNGRSESDHSCNPASSCSGKRFYKRVWFVSSISTEIVHGTDD